ncbi:unnamed protein product [Spirodela intermedia]|uniref:Uncharacterized protein n=1 Tax=Spirodela intermedia TaxID=51605 RepID=A0A7I8K2I3_SPIIN|nr:unnamed protein product [Spirodela intermedia]
MALAKFAASLLTVVLVAASVSFDPAEAKTCMQVCMPQCLQLQYTNYKECFDACRDGCKPANTGRGLHEVNPPAVSE